MQRRTALVEAAIGLLALASAGSGVAISGVLADAPAIVTHRAAPKLSRAEQAVASELGDMRLVEFDSLPADATNPLIAAGELHFYWSQIEPHRGVFNWSVIDAAMAPWIAAGKKVVLRVSPAGDARWSKSAGDATPPWVYDAGTPQVRTPDGSVLPVYWDRHFQRNWANFIAVMARRYDGDPSIAYIEAGLGEGGETLAETETNDPQRAQRWNAVGYSDAVWTAYLQRTIRVYLRYWKRTPFAVMVDATYLDASSPTAPAPAIVRLEHWMIHKGVPQFQTNGLEPQEKLPPDWHDVTISAEERNCSCGDGPSLTALVATARSDHAAWLLLYPQDIASLLNH